MPGIAQKKGEALPNSEKVAHPFSDHFKARWPEYVIMLLLFSLGAGLLYTYVELVKLQTDNKGIPDEVRANTVTVKLNKQKLEWIATNIQENAHTLHSIELALAADNPKRTDIDDSSAKKLQGLTFSQLDTVVTATKAIDAPDDSPGRSDGEAADVLEPKLQAAIHELGITTFDLKNYAGALKFNYPEDEAAALLYSLPNNIAAEATQNSSKKTEVDAAEVPYAPMTGYAADKKPEQQAPAPFNGR